MGDAGAQTAEFRLGRLGIVAASLGIVVISLALTLLTYRIGHSPGTVPIEWQWNLRWERNFAAWWSGSLLAVAAFLAFDNADATDDSSLRKSWTTFALIVLFLAADEIGSFHERMGHISEAMDAGSWAFAIPLALAIAYLSVRAGWTLLLRGGMARAQVLIMAFGFAILLSVAVQEYFEHAIDWEASGLSALRAMVEEGSELVGIAIVIVAVGLPLWHGGLQLFAGLASRRRAIFVGAAVLFLPLLAVSADLSPDKGYPSDWLASALMLGAACLWLRRSATHTSRLLSLALSALCLLGSLVAVAITPGETFSATGWELSQRGLILVFVASGLLILADRKAGLLAVLVAACLLVVPAIETIASPLWAFILTPMFGLAAFWQAAQMPSRPAAQNGMSSSRSS